MSSLSKFWRVPALALVFALPFAAACADDQGASPVDQTPPPVTGTVSGTVTGPGGGGVVGALVGTSPATSTALTDASGNYSITNIPVPASGSASFAVTASKEGFNSASTSVTLSASSPTATANLQLTQDPGPVVPTTGNLNVLVTNRQGVAQSGADVTVNNASGSEVATATTDANGFALFTNLNAGSYTVFASKTISGIPFQASGGASVQAGETSFLQLSLSRDLGQTVFPNIGGENVTLGDGSDIEFVPVPGGDSNPEVDCNIIRTQHMFIAEVRNEDGDLVSGVRVDWDLNISENGTITVECPDLVDDPAGCGIPTVPGNTGSIVDTDDPDLDPSTARSGLSPAFKVDSRFAVTFTNDNSQTVSFGGSNVTVGAGQTWIVITSPVEGVTDVIASTPDIPKTNPNCAIDDPGACDKEFAIKRWVNWDTRVYEATWPNNPGPTRDIHDDGDATFNRISNGGLVVNILDRRELAADDDDNPSYPGVNGCDTDWSAAIAGTQCELTENRALFVSEVRRLRSDSPFNISRGRMIWDVTDDSPDMDFWGENPGNNGDGCLNGVCNAEHNGPSDDQYWIDSNSPGGLITTRNRASVEFDANNNAFDGGVITANPLCTQPCDEDDFIGYGVIEARLDPTVYWCHDVDGDNDCNPGAAGSPDSFSTAYQRLLANTVDNQNSLRVRFLDEFGEVCSDFTFRKRWVTSRLTIIKTTPDATVRTVSEANGGPDINASVPRPLKTHTVQVGQSFSYTITVINDGDIRSQNVRITDTLPRFGTQFTSPPPDAGAPVMRNGNQAFEFQRDRPAFDPTAIVYAIDDDNNAPGDQIDRCIRGDDGTTTGNAYVVPTPCTGITTDAGTVDQARAAAISASTSGAVHDQVVWIQWFDDEILARTQVGGGIQSEDSVEVFLSTNQNYASLPNTWCNIATVTDGPENLLRDDRPQSFDADTLCHEVREALLDVRKTATDAVITAGGNAVWDVEIANNGSATLTNVVIHDTVDQSLAGRKLVSTDISVAAGFPNATVTINPDSFTFSVAIGNLAPTNGFVDAFTVSVPTKPQAGTFCNRVTARGTNPAGTLIETDISCITTTVAIEMDVSNEDGFIDAGGVFQSAKEIFTVGDSGNGFAYQVIITNQSGFTATGVRVVDNLAPNTQIFTFDGFRSGFPTKGTTSGVTNNGFTWNIGTLNPGESAEIQFFADAQLAGDDVNEVRLTADQLTGVKIDQEPTTISN